MVKEFDFSGEIEGGLYVAAGGFEDRACAFVKRLRRRRFAPERCVVIRYANQVAANQPNYMALTERLGDFTPRIETVSVDDGTPIQSCAAINTVISEAAGRLDNHRLLLDISAMRHIWAIEALHAGLTYGLKVDVIYTEARSYFPRERERARLLESVKSGDLSFSLEFFQSAALKSVDIIPEFGGNFRPGRQTCLIVFAGFEPNRIDRLIDAYAPGRVVVFYGVSPRPELKWRTELSMELHRETFSSWHTREDTVSTLEVDSILSKLEEVFSVVRPEYDVAISPHCSKMQGVATYLFWHRHPEVQMVFSSPVKFNPTRYSVGFGKTYQYSVDL